MKRLPRPSISSVYTGIKNAKSIQQKISAATGGAFTSIRGLLTFITPRTTEPDTTGTGPTNGPAPTTNTHRGKLIETERSAEIPHEFILQPWYTAGGSTVYVSYHTPKTDSSGHMGVIDHTENKLLLPETMQIEGTDIQSLSLPDTTFEELESEIRKLYRNKRVNELTPRDHTVEVLPDIDIAPTPCVSGDAIRFTADSYQSTHTVTIQPWRHPDEQATYLAFKVDENTTQKGVLDLTNGRFGNKSFSPDGATATYHAVSLSTTILDVLLPEYKSVRDA